MNDSNLGSPNNFWRVTRPFAAYVQTGSVPSNAWYGSARIFRPVYERTTLAAGDEIHNLHGGLFAVVDDGKAYPVKMEEPEWAPFERSQGRTERFPLDRLEEIPQSQAEKVRYAGRLDRIAERVARSRQG